MRDVELVLELVVELEDAVVEVDDLLVELVRVEEVVVELV